MKFENLIFVTGFKLHTFVVCGGSEYDHSITHFALASLYKISASSIILGRANALALVLPDGWILIKPVSIEPLLDSSNFPSSLQVPPGDHSQLLPLVKARCNQLRFQICKL